jgi:hypothetical protein
MTVRVEVPQALCDDNSEAASNNQGEEKADISGNGMS